MQSHGLRQLFVAAFVLMLLAAACGGKQHDVAARTTSAQMGTTTPAPPETTSTTASSPTTTVAADDDPVEADDGRNDTQDPRAQTISIDTTVDSATWGDPPLQIEASSSSGGSVRFAASGACGATSSGTVTIDAAGSCTVTATQPGNADWAPASASLTFTIEPAQPVLSMVDMEIRFEKNLLVPFGATSTPPIPLAFELFTDQNTYGEDACDKAGEEFWFHHDPIPELAAFCAVRVSAAEASPNYLAPEPVTAYIEVLFPSWKVHFAELPETVSYEQSGGSLSVMIFEDSGDAYGMSVFASGACSFDDDFGEDASPGYPVADPTFSYAVTVPLLDPSNPEGEACTLRAEAEPLNHYGGIGEDTVSFVVTP